MQTDVCVWTNIQSVWISKTSGSSWMTIQNITSSVFCWRQMSLFKTEEAQTRMKTDVSRVTFFWKVTIKSLIFLHSSDIKPSWIPDAGRFLVGGNYLQCYVAGIAWTSSGQDKCRLHWPEIRGCGRVRGRGLAERGEMEGTVHSSEWWPDPCSGWRSHRYAWRWALSISRPSYLEDTKTRG